jgi:predicted XRE-type DNA-binding protein
MMDADALDDAFDAVCDAAAGRANMKARAELMLGIRERIKAWDLPAEEAAQRFGVTQSCFNDLERGDIDGLSLDTLVNIAASAGYVVHVALEDIA